MAGEWEDVEDEGPVNIVNITQPDKEWVDVEGHKLPLPKLPLPVVDVQGGLWSPNVRHGVETKLAHDERANTSYLQDVLEQRGPGKFELAYEAQNTPWSEVPNKIAVIAGRETSKLGAGAKDLANFLRFVFGTDTMQERSMDYKLRQEKEEGEKDRLYQEMAENQGISSVGAVLPYLTTGALAGPAARSVAGRGIQLANQAAEGTVRAGRGLVVRGVDAAANAPGTWGAPLRWAGQKAQVELTNDLQRRAAQRAAQLPFTSPYRVNLMRDLLAGGGVGAVEGGLHYDRSVFEGAVNGLLGMSGGKFIESPFLRAPNYWNANERRLLEWMKDKGYRATPGMETGSRRLQRFEHGIREFDPTADHMGILDRHNQAVANRVAANSIGMSNPTGAPFDPVLLGNHLRTLGREYDDLVAGTTGRLNNRNIRNILQTVDALRLNQSPEAQRAFRIAESYVNQIRAAAPVTRGANGRFQAAVLPGPEFQRINTAIRADINSAVGRSEQATVNALTPILRELNNSIDRGMIAHGGRVAARQWRDLNERWAMANLLMQDGLHMTGSVDLKKLGNHFMATDARRMLTESGGRITDLQRLAKGDYMVRNQAGSGLSGAGILNDGSQSFTQKMLQTPLLGRMPILPQLYMDMYLRGIPSVRGIGGIIPGFQGAKGTGAFTIPQVARANDQATERKWSIGKSIIELPQTMEEFLDELRWTKGD